MNERALELFRTACGLRAPLGLECEGPISSAAGSFDRSFDCPYVLVGRDPESDLILDDGQVSRRHAILQVVAGQVFVFDLQSRSKVCWEGEEAPRSRGWLVDGRSIRIGPYRIRRSGSQVVADPPGEFDGDHSPLEPERSEADPLPRAALELPIRLGVAPSLWRMESRLTFVGRSDPCQLVLADDSVSRIHAHLVRTPFGVWVIDLQAREGTHVNGERVRWAWLGEGDAVRIGSFTFVLRYETPPAQISRQDVPLESGASRAAHPGTQLAVRAQPTDNNRAALRIRSRDRSQGVLKEVSSSPSIAPATLIPSTGEAWELSTPYPPNAMAMWRQQMHLMESFHNDMIMMVQMFFAMHREHLASARDELDRVEQLTRELSSLQARLVEPASHGAGLTTGVDRTSRERRLQEPVDGKRSDKESVSREPTSSGRTKAPKLPKPAGISGQGSPQRPSPRVPAPKAPDRASAADDLQLHALLTKRITELQRERQGYWQKIIKKMNK